MAFIHTPAPENATEGARHFQQLFSSDLPDGYHLWQYLELPESETAVDFAIFQPKYGVWIVQLNDWQIDQIREIDQEYCVLIEDGKEILKRNPILDAKDNHHKIRNLLLQDSSLLHKHGPMEGNLLFPVHHLAVFNHLTRKNLEESGFDDRFPPYHIITTDMFENPDNKSRFAEHLLLEKRFPRFYNHLGLTSEQIDAVVNILNPLADVDAPASPAVSGESTPAEAVIPQPVAQGLPQEETALASTEVESAEAPPDSVEESSEPDHSIDPAADEQNTIEEIAEANELQTMEENTSPSAQPASEQFPAADSPADAAAPPAEAPAVEEHTDERLTRVIQQETGVSARDPDVTKAAEPGEADNFSAPNPDEPVDESVIKSIVDSIREIGVPEETGDLESRTAAEVIERTGHVPIAIEENEEGFDAETRVALKKIIELNHQILQRIWSRS